jgi:hypothetical protein
MFSIGEFARLGGVSVRTLRHYDEIGLLRPATVDQDTGYRGYTADQLGQLNRVMALKELGRYRAVIGSNREVWVNEVDDIADVAQQVFEIQLPFTRPGPPAAD